MIFHLYVWEAFQQLDVKSDNLHVSFMSSYELRKKRVAAAVFLKVHLSVSLQGARNNAESFLKPLLELTLITYKIINLTKTHIGSGCKNIFSKRSTFLCMYTAGKCLARNK